jgi:hypothetical protein
MPTKADIKKILSKGLTGREAGKLIFQDNWLADTGRGGFLSERDMSSIKAGLKTDRDIKEYNSYVRLYKYVDYTLKEVRISSLEAESYLYYIYLLLQPYERAETYRWTSMYIPAIVTQKQYEELSAKQRDIMLKRAMSLQELISILSGVELEYILDEDEPEPVIDFQKDEKLIQAVEKVKELLKEGRLKPLKLKEWRDYYQAHKLKIPAQPVKEVVEMLDKILAGELQYDEDDSLRLTVFRGQNLYEIEELEGWIKEEIEEYSPNWDVETGARPEGMMQSRYVAIIQNPLPEDLDKRGYWIERDYLGSYRKPDTKRDSGLITGLMDASKERIKGFLAVQSVLEAICKVIEVDFLEDLEQWREELQSIVEVINRLIDSLDGSWERLGLPELKPIKMGRMKATASTIRYFRERMALALGENWWEEPRDNFKLEADEPDTLAQEFSEELEEVMEQEMRKRGVSHG